MSILSFIKEAGEKLFGHKEASAAVTQAQAAPDNAALQAQAASANQTAAAAIATYLSALANSRQRCWLNSVRLATCTEWTRCAS